MNPRLLLILIVALSAIGTVYAACDPALVNKCEIWAEAQVSLLGCKVDLPTFTEVITDLYLNKGCRLEGTRWFDVKTGSAVKGSVDDSGKNTDTAGCIARYTPASYLAKGGYFRTPKEALNGALRNKEISGCEYDSYKGKKDARELTEPIIAKVVSCECAKGKDPGPTPNWKGKNLPSIHLTAVDGDAESLQYIPKGSTEPKTLTSDVELKQGDTILSGFQTKARFSIGNRDFAVGELTQVRIDDFFSAENFERTRLYLLIGMVSEGAKEVEIRSHRPGIRSDFSVATPTASSSPRGTEFIEQITKDGSTTIYVLNGIVDVNDTKGKTVSLTEGKKVTSTAQGLTAVESFAEAEITPIRDAVTVIDANAVTSGWNSTSIILVVVLLAVMAGIVLFFVKRQS